MNTLFTDAVLIRSLVLFLMLGSVAGLFAGAALLMRPDWLSRIGKHANHWVSTRQMSRPLVKIFNVEAWFYRHNRLAGGALLLAAVYLIYYFTVQFNKQAAMISIGRHTPLHPSLLDGLLDAMVLGCFSGAVFAAIVSLYLMLRPSMLRELELRANSKTSVRQRLKPLEIIRGGVDSYVFKHVRLTGWVILAGSFYTLLVLLAYWEKLSPVMAK